jgi:presqualene diphosphate synthase
MTPPLGVAQADIDQVEAMVRAAGTSFYRGMRVLPAERRAAMYAIYAFCRMVDDIADAPGAFEDKRRRLASWRARIDDVYAGRSDEPVTRVLAAAVPRFALRQGDFLAVIDGMQMDAETAIVAPDLATLDLYCDRVAAAVGRLSVRAFGDSSEAADRVAYSLGRALQLTNVLRDLGEDAGLGRLYLPREWLACRVTRRLLLAHPVWQRFASASPRWRGGISRMPAGPCRSATGAPCVRPG